MNPLRMEGDIFDAMMNASDLNSSIRSIRIGNQNSRRWFSNNRLEILPDIYSDDIRLQTFIQLVIKRCKELGNSETQNGVFVGPPKLDDIDKLNCDAGSIRLPLHYGRNRRTVKLDDRDRKLLHAVVRLATRDYDGNVAGIISKDSNSGFPYFSTNDEFKHKHLGMFSENLDLFRELFLKRDRENLLKYLGLVNVSTTQIRRQHDKFVDGRVKYREIIDFEQSFFKEGTPLDKDIVAQISMNGSRATCRTRVVCAMPGLLNNAMSAIFEGYKSPFFKTFARTLKHRGIPDIVKKCSAFKYFVGVDIASFDSNAPENIITEIIDVLPVNDLCKEVIYDLLYNPWYLSDFNGKAVITESFRNKTYSTFKGMPSGIFFTTWINCVQVIFYKLVEYRRFIPNIDDKIIEFLNHQLDVGSLLMSDDGIDFYNKKEYYDEIMKFGFENKYIDFELEDGISFLGVCLFRDSNDEIRGCNKLTSYFEKLYLPENGIYTRYRPLPIRGMRERRQIYSNHPEFLSIREIEEQCFYEAFKVRLGVMEDEWYKSELELYKNMANLPNLSPVDVEVLASPSKIHYKYSTDEVSSEVLEFICRRVDMSVCDKLREAFI